VYRLRRHLATRLVAAHLAANVAARRALRLALGERLLDAVRAERVAARQLFGLSGRTHADGAVVYICWRRLIRRTSCLNVKTLASVKSITIRYKTYVYTDVLD